MSPLRLLKNGILTENPTFVLVLGLCPTLAVTSSASNGFGMGLAATAVLMGSNVMISMIRKFIPDEIRIPAFIVVIAGFVTIIQLLISAYAPALDKSLGIFIPLIVVNCIILARAEAFAFKNGVIGSLFDGIGMGLGFTFALTFIGSIRELLGNGTVFNFSLIPSFYQPALLVILAPGGFITLGILIALFRNLQLRKEEASAGFKPDFDGWKKLDACEGCALKKYCGGGGLSVPCAKEEKEGDS
ncbi:MULTISPECIES: electron transport complex subunit RsxE [Synergistaceae]|uniref:electron transport complex subunit RsxE n=1 Tax=Synergistaceae TaxID=649777 RepID=UPI003BE4BD2C